MRARPAVILALLVMSFLMHGAPAFGAAEDTIAVTGNLQDTRTTPPTPVPGVRLGVEIEGQEVVQGVSAADGRFTLTLPGSADDLLGQTITVNLDTATLPEGTDLTQKDRSSYEIVVKTNADIPISYRIGPEAPAGPSTATKALQSFVNGIFLGLLLAVTAIGLSLVFGTTGLTNFAHGELITFGALMAYFFQDSLSWAFIPAALIAVLLSGVFGYANDKVLWKPLRNRGTGLIAMMIVSIGLAIFLRNVFQYLFDADNHQYTDVPIPREPWQIGSIDISQRTFWSGVICAAVLCLVALAVQRTRLGKATRAVSDNPALAASSGIDVDRVIRTIWIFGGALAGLGGILWGMNYGFDYQVGFKILLAVFAAVTLGGLGTIWGTIVGALIIGILTEMSTLVISPELKYVTPLVVLILMLLIRPQGLLGRAERVG